MAIKEPQDATERRCELLVVGAGLAALHLVARLPEDLLKGTVVVDSSGAWLASWAEGLERLAAPLLRTPVMQHPHAKPLALEAYTERQGREQELVPVVKGFAPVPTLTLFKDFCRIKVVQRLPPAARRPRHDSVTRIEPLGSQGCRVYLASGRSLLAHAVAYTPAHCVPVLPQWARPLLETQPLLPAAIDAVQKEAPTQPAVAATSATAQPCPPETAACEPCLRQRHWPLPPGIFTGEDVDLRSAELAGSHVVVVGGGMAAGLLAAGAAERGAHVTLICRRPLKPQPFETQVGWWGMKQLNAYRQLESGRARVAACRRARRQGSIHLPVWRRLTQQAAAGRLTVLEGWQVAGAEPARPAMDTAKAASTAGSAEDCTQKHSGWWLRLEAYGTAAEQQGLAVAPTLFQQAVAASPAAAAAAAPGDNHSGELEAASDSGQRQQSWQHAGQPDPGEQQQQQGQGRVIATQQVWLACGRAYNAASDPVLQSLQQACPAPLVGGYAWPDDESLCWPGAAVYLLGRGTMLSLGPAAGDMPGMRLAADKVAQSLKRLGFAGEPVWEEAAQKLLKRLRAKGLAALPASHTHHSGGAAPAENGGGDAGLRRELAAALEAAARSEGAVVLEEEGQPFEDAKPRAKVAKPDNVIDISDLGPALPRRELQHYKFMDDEFELCIICQLDEAVPLDQVRVLFGEQHLEMWAVGAEAAYHLHIPRLYGRILPKKCRARVNQKAKKVYLLLHKVCDAEWRFIKS